MMMLRPLQMVFVSGALAVQIFTQSLAWQARYHPALGRPVTTLHLGPSLHGVYWPWQGGVWAWHWGRAAMPTMCRAGTLALLPVLGAGLLYRRQYGADGGTGPPPMTGHGSTTWATRRDVTAAGLTARRGIIVGQWGRRGPILRYDGEENILVVGPQRSGKGTGMFIPTLLEMEGHTITVDVRGETHAATAAYRATKSRVLRLAITQRGSARFNLLQEVRRGTDHAFFDAAVLADMLVNPGGGLEHRDHWDKTAQALITCGILYEVHKRAIPTLAHMTSFWSHPGRSLEATLQYVLETAPHAAVAELAQEVLNKSPNERSGVLSSMMTQLFVFRDPVVAENTASSDFRLADFTRHDRWVSLYLVQSPEEEEHVRPFLRCFLRLAMGRWLEMSEHKHAITLLLDEFTSYGKISFYAENLAYLGGRGIRSVLAVQNVPQLRDTYGHADTILEHCKIRVFYSANGQTTGDEISRQTGTGTATTVQASWRYEPGRLLQAHSQQAHLHARPLLTAAESMQIPPDIAVIQVASHAPIWARKVRFWEHRRWYARSRMR